MAFAPPPLRTPARAAEVAWFSALCSDDYEFLGVPDGRGALISIVQPGGPAARAGLQPGDVVVEYNARPVEDNTQLVTMVVATKPGTTVPVTVIRDKQRRSINITVDELDLEAEAGGRAANDRPQEEAERTATGFGMTIEPITPEYAREAELPRNRGGAVIVSIERNSAAFNAGLQRGDIILEVNRQAVNNASQVTKALQSAPDGTPVFLLVWRGGQEQFVTMSKR